MDGTYYNTLPRGPAGAPCVLRGDPSGTAFVAGSSYPYYWKQIGNSSLNFAAAATDPPTANAEAAGKARHMETINVLFLDGHAKNLPYIKLIADEGLTVGGLNSLWNPYKQGCN